VSRFFSTFFPYFESKLLELVEAPGAILDRVSGLLGGGQMFSHIIDALFGCTHRRYTFPITAKKGQHRSEAASVTGTYVVCLDCGREFPYDWRQMKVVSLSHSSASVAEPAESYAERAA
jgi:hypothetical protein